MQAGLITHWCLSFADVTASVAALSFLPCWFPCRHRALDDCLVNVAVFPRLMEDWFTRPGALPAPGWDHTVKDPVVLAECYLREQEREEEKRAAKHQHTPAAAAGVRQQQQQVLQVPTAAAPCCHPVTGCILAAAVAVAVAGSMVVFLHELCMGQHKP